MTTPPKPPSGGKQPEKEYIFFRESAIQSIISDVFSFGCLFGGFLINRYFLYGRWYIDFFLIYCFFVLISARGKSKLNRFTDLKKLKEHINSL